MRLPSFSQIFSSRFVSGLIATVGIGIGGFASTPSLAEDLTAEQKESLLKKLETIKETLDDHLSNRNTNAGSIFIKASGSRTAAVDLYLECHKLVNFEREGLSDSDFRAWKEDRSDRLRSEEFGKSLQMQLLYLGLSCQAAEVKEIDDIFTPLTNFVDNLSNLDEMPDQLLMQSVGNSIFAQAYHLEKLLGQNPNWEPVPFNIEGIYDKSILPHLRIEKPEALMGAWDRRIAQQTQLAEFLEKKKIEELRGLDRDEKRRTRMSQNRERGVVGSYDRDDFLLKTLPNLKWSKLEDMYKYVNQLEGAKSMISYIEGNLTHPEAESWFSRFEAVISSKTSEESTPPVSN